MVLDAMQLDIVRCLPVRFKGGHVRLTAAVWGRQCWPTCCVWWPSCPSCGRCRRLCETMLHGALAGADILVQTLRAYGWEAA